MTDLRENFDLKKVGGHLSRQRYQRGSLKAYVPAGKGKPKRPLPRGTYWARWYRYVRQADGLEKRSPREKIITKELARSLRIGTEYEGPLTEADAQRVLDLLIARDAGTYTPPDTTATFVKVAREYLATAEPGWGPHTVRTSKGLIESVLIGGRLGNRPVIELTEIELQQFLNEHVAAGASRSELSKMLLYMRNILDHAVMKKILAANPARNPGYRLKAKSRRQVSERYLSFDECRLLLSVVSGGDHLAIRILIQLGLRSEELFALRRDDVLGDLLRIDEALVDGNQAPVKTDASDASVYIPPDLQVELQGWLEWLGPDPRGWLFPAPKAIRWALVGTKLLKPSVEACSGPCRSRGVQSPVGKGRGRGIDRREFPGSAPNLRDVVRSESKGPKGHAGAIAARRSDGDVASLSKIDSGERACGGFGLRSRVDRKFSQSF